MPEFTPDEIIRRIDRLHSIRTTVMHTWDIIELFISPYRGRMFEPNVSEHEIRWRRREIYDSTAVNAAQTLANSLHGSLTSPAVQWFDLRFRDDEINENREAQAWIEDSAERIWKALGDSNFGVQMGEAYLDLVTFGTAVTVAEERRINEQYAGLDFVTVPVKEIYFEETDRAQAHVFYRLVKLTASQIVAMCKESGKDCPKRVQDDYDNARLDTKHEVVFCVYPREDKRGADVSGVLAPTERPYGYRWIMKNGGEEIGEEGGYYEMPVYITRWMKVSGSAWGHSPAHLALSDVLSLNQAMADWFERIEREIRPPGVTTVKNVIGDWSWDGDTLNIARDPDAINWINPQGNPSTVQVTIEDWRNRIEQTFFVDKLQLKESPAMTATEVMARVELMNRLIGPTMARLQSDLLDPLIQRCFNIMWRAGQFADPPQVVTESGAEMDIEYMGPLSRAQKSDQAMASREYVMELVELAAATGRQEILDNVDFDAFAREQHAARQVPALIMKSQDVVERERRARAQQQQAQQQLIAAQEAGAAMQAVGEGAQALTAIEGGAGAAE